MEIYLIEQGKFGAISIDRLPESLDTTPWIEGSQGTSIMEAKLSFEPRDHAGGPGVLISVKEGVEG